MSENNCVTHHICDCLQAKIDRLEKKNKLLRDGMEWIEKKEQRYENHNRR